MTEPPGKAGNPEPADAPSDGPPAQQHWSPNQPPPSEWQVPPAAGPQGAPGGPRGQAGPGGPGRTGAPGGPGSRPNAAFTPYPTQQQGWHDAPKPGVIPLRPLRLGEIFDGAITTSRLYWRTTLGVTAVVGVLIQVVTGLATWATQDKVNDFTDRFRAMAESTPPPSLHDVAQLLRDMLPTMLVSLGVVQLLAFLGMLTVTSVITIVIGRAVIGAPLTPREALAEARPRLLHLALLTIVVAIIPLGALAAGLAPLGVAMLLGVSGDGIIGLAMLFVLVGVGFAIHFGIRLTLAGPSLMLEKQGIGRSISRALKLSKGSWWRIFGIQLLVVIITGVISLVLSLPFQSIAGILFSTTGGAAGDLGYYTVVGIGGLIGMLLTYPFSAGVTALIYADQRIRRESLDLDLARAAGIPTR